MPVLATFRYYAELNDFLSLEHRGVPFQYEFSEHQSIKDLMEAQGVPHGEVDLILINGKSASFSARLKENDYVSLFPAFETLKVDDITRVRPEKLTDTRFLLDVPLGRLASHLRLFGFDTLWRRDYEDEELVELSRTESRILLTRDRRLLMRKEVRHGYFVREVYPASQLAWVIQRFHLENSILLFRRCLRCNGLLESVDKNEVDEKLEPKTRLYFHEFSRCPGCQRIYWKGSHYEKIQTFVSKILDRTNRLIESH